MSNGNERPERDDDYKTASGTGDMQEASTASSPFGKDQAASDAEDLESEQSRNVEAEPQSQTVQQEPVGREEETTSHITVKEATQKAGVRVDATLFNDDNLPGSDYDPPYYVERAVGDHKASYDRDGDRRFDVFESTEEQLDKIHEHFDEEVYPNKKVNLNDIQEAAMLAGFYNPDTMQKILDAWGWEE